MNTWTIKKIYLTCIVNTKCEITNDLSYLHRINCILNTDIVGEGGASGRTAQPCQERGSDETVPMLTSWSR